jgi:hypothetical protein
MAGFDGLESVDTASEMAGLTRRSRWTPWRRKLPVLISIRSAGRASAPECRRPSDGRKMEVKRPACPRPRWCIARERADDAVTPSLIKIAHVCLAASQTSLPTESSGDQA